MNIKIPINNFFCPHEVFEDIKFKKLPLSSRYLYIVLCKLTNRYSNQDSEGWFFRSIEQLACDTNLSKRTIMRAKNELKTKQFIDVKRGYYKHNKKRTYDYFRLNGFRFRTK